MSFRKKNSAGDNGIYFNARRLSNPDTKKLKDDRGVGEDGLYGSPQQAYSIPRFVSKIYYRLGLLCASYPRVVLIFTFLAIVWSCFPLFSLPLYSTRPQIHVQTLNQLVREYELGKHLSGAGFSSELNISDHLHQGKDKIIPRNHVNHFTYPLYGIQFIIFFFV